MPISITCKSCSSRFRVADDMVGRQVKCPKCKNAIRVDAAAPQPRDVRPAPEAAETRKPPRKDPEPGWEEIDEVETATRTPAGSSARGSNRPEDEEQEERLPPRRSNGPRRKSAARAKDDTSNKAGLLLAVGLGGAALCLICVIAGVYIARSAGSKGDEGKTAELPARKLGEGPPLPLAPTDNQNPLLQQLPGGAASGQLPGAVGPGGLGGPGGLAPSGGLVSGQQVYQRLLKSIVYVETTRGWASGALVDASNRLVVSNHHALKEVDRARAVFPTYQDGRLITDFNTVMQSLKNNTGDVLQAEVVYRDATRDLALLRLDKLPQGARPLMMAAASVGPGQPVHTVGARPVGTIDAFWNYLSGSVRQAVHQEQWSYRDRQQCQAMVLATQLPIGAGNGGGPIVNDRCELVAVHGGGDEQADPVRWGIDIGEIKTVLERYAHVTGTQLALEQGAGPLSLQPAASLADLIRDVGEKDRAVRVRALLAMAELGAAARPALPALLKALQDRDDGIRRQASEVLDKIGTPAASDLPVLVEALREPDIEVRLYAARTLGKMGAGARDAAPALQEVLKDRHLPLRRQALIALSQIHISPDQCSPAFLAGLKDGEPKVREAVAAALMELGPNGKVAIPALVEALGSTEGGVRALAAQVLKAIGPPARDALPALKKALQDDDKSAGRAAAVAVVAIDPHDAGPVSILIETLAEGDVAERRAATLALKKLGPKAKDAVNPLAKALHDDDKQVRSGAAAALGAIGADAKAAVATLIIDLKDKDRRDAALDALERIGAPAVAALADAVQFNRHAQVRKAAAEALGNIGPAAKSAAVALSRAYTTDRSKEVREAAQEALTRIQQR